MNLEKEIEELGYSFKELLYMPCGFLDSPKTNKWRIIGRISKDDGLNKIVIRAETAEKAFEKLKEKLKIGKPFNDTWPIWKQNE